MSRPFLLGVSPLTIIVEEYFEENTSDSICLNEGHWVRCKPKSSDINFQNRPIILGRIDSYTISGMSLVDLSLIDMI